MGTHSASPTDRFLFLWEAIPMTKKDCSSNIKTIEEVRKATLADVQRIAEKLHIASSKNAQTNRSILTNR